MATFKISKLSLNSSQIQITLQIPIRKILFFFPWRTKRFATLREGALAVR